MKIKFLFLSTILFFCNGFIPSKIITIPKIILHSHFSKINTKLKNKDLLIKTLVDINKPVVYSDIPSIVKGYNNESVLADIVIKQKNGKDIGFYLNGDNYEMVTDLQFWEQSVPVEVFLENLYQHYAYNSVIEHCKEEGFTTESIKRDTKMGIIEIEVSKYNY